MKKVLFVAHSGEISGGANRSLLSIVSQLRDHYNISPSVLIPEENSPFAAACNAKGIPVYTGRYHGCCTVFRREPKDMLRLVKLLTAPALDWWEAARLDRRLPADFDLVYTNERMIIVGGFLAKRRGVPHVWHVRSFGKENKTRFPLFWMRLMDRYSKRIILISRALYDGFAGKIHPEKLRMIHNGVEIDRYKVEERTPHDGFRMLLAGRLVPAKGQDEAIEALKCLAEENITDVELFLAGDAPSYEGRDYSKKLAALVRTYGLEKKVHFLGEVEDLPELRKSMDAELVCSWCEAFGRVTVEAMCAGLPVIGTNAGGTPDVLENEKTGFLYEAHDVKSFADRIKWLHDHPEKAREMGERGRVRAQRLFSIERCTGNISNVINESILEDK